MNEDDNKAEHPVPDRQTSDMHRRQRGKNIALALLLAGLVVLFYIVAIVKMGGS